MSDNLEISREKMKIALLRIHSPLFMGALYGIYNFITLGLSAEHFWYSYFTFFGAIFSAIGFNLYIKTFFLEKRRNWKTFLSSNIGFLPVFYCMYLFFYLGGYKMYKYIFVEFSFWQILFAIFWLSISWRMIKQLEEFSDIGLILFKNKSKMDLK